MASLEMWIFFSIGIIFASLAIDKCATSDCGTISIKRASLILSLWVCLALIFGMGIYYYIGSKKALKFLMGYSMELLLSVDNVLLFIVIFRNLSIPNKQQYNILFVGILAAIIMRLLIIVLLTKAIAAFHWVSYLLAVLLIFTGIKMWPSKQRRSDKKEVKNNRLINFLSRIMPISDKLDGNKLMIREGGKLYCTRIAIAIILIMQTDLLFAMDSIPAIIAITKDNFIIFSSNLFALLGLRSLFFVVHHITRRIAFLNYALSLLLIFMGAKIGMKIAGISIPIGVMAITTILIVFVSYLIWKDEKVEH